jgi:hypothetical protein
VNSGGPGRPKRAPLLYLGSAGHLLAIFAISFAVSIYIHYGLDERSFDMRSYVEAIGSALPAGHSCGFDHHSLEDGSTRARTPDALPFFFGWATALVTSFFTYQRALFA